MSTTSSSSYADSPYGYLTGSTYLSAHELFTTIENSDDMDECTNLLWQQQHQIDRLEHFRYVNETIRRLEEETERHRIEVQRIFNVMESEKISEKLKPMIMKKRRQRYHALPRQHRSRSSDSSTRSVMIQRPASPTSSLPDSFHSAKSKRQEVESDRYFQGIYERKKRCYKCGRYGHTQKNCHKCPPARTTSNLESST